MGSIESFAEEDHASRARAELGYSRWWQIVAACTMMALVSPFQYVWSAIEGPLAADHVASLSVIGFVFTAYVIIMALAQYPAGWWRDRHGPRSLSIAAGVLAGGGYVATGLATEVWHVFLAYSVGAIGVGMVYTVAVNTALKWFPDKRGLTTGLGTMAFGAGGAIFVPYVRAHAAAGTYDHALQVMGIIIGLGVIVGAIILRDPPVIWTEVATDGGDRDIPERIRQYTSREVLRTWQFWVMYFMFFAVSAAGLMVTAKIILYAEFTGRTALVATLSATLIPIASGGGRLVLGGLSDRFRRETLMWISYLLCGAGVLLLVASGNINSDLGFVIGAVIAVFFWSSQFSLFPSVVGDYYGTKHSSANYALLYSGKMWGGVFGGGVVGWLVLVVGWDVAFLIGGGLALLAGLAGIALRSPR